jgi:hypothetical protein
MLKLFLSMSALSAALSACTLGLQTAESQRERATSVALRYLAQQHSALPPDYTTKITLSEWVPELAPSELVYIVDVRVRRNGKEKTLYSIPVSAERFYVKTLDRMGVLTPVGR